jgi:alpha-glucuronidase
MKSYCFLLLLFLTGPLLKAENGHDLWLRTKASNEVNVVCKGKSATLDIAIRELKQGWTGKQGETIILSLVKDKTLKNNGFRIKGDEIQANTDLGLLYGVYELLRAQQTGEPVSEITSIPSYENRILDHWDNPNGTIERGYAGLSIFWHAGNDSLSVTDQDKKLWQEYARANASVGINGSVLNNVNATPFMLSEGYLGRVKAVADVLRPYGVKTYLSINFSSPVALGGLKTSDPLDPEVIRWWKDKTKEIYTMIPDFGGFLVKANSEGQPGPQDNGRTHVDGANMLADALKPFGGIVMWRAFVYTENGQDRAKAAFDQFTPLDGMFRDNVIVQLKIGPVDFQPREPFSPLFGAMKKTSVMPEVQVTQEYLGHSIHLVFLSTMWEECLKSDTYQAGAGSTVARCTDGSIFPQVHTAIAGVANIGLDTNWCGYHFAQANWYAFGRLAWNNTLKSEQIADEWIRLTFGPLQPEQGNSYADWTENFLNPVKKMMLESREATVDYMTPLGLHHFFAPGDHYGPSPWYAPKNTRMDWTPPFYHKADANGIGFDRTDTGNDLTGQYREPVASTFNDLDKCPEKYLLFFHHLPWDYKMKSGKTLWDEICYHYQSGVEKVREFQKVWDQVEPYIDSQRFSEVQSKLRSQANNAQVWKDACLLYFQQINNRPVPYDIERPVHELDYLMTVRSFKSLQ